MKKQFCLSIAANVLNQNQNHGDFYLDYYLLEELISGEDGIGLMTYGVEVVKRTSYPDKSEVLEKCEIKDIFFSKDDVIAFMQMLSRNCVTPATLLDVVEDLLNDHQGYFNFKQGYAKAI